MDWCFHLVSEHYDEGPHVFWSQQAILFWIANAEVRDQLRSEAINSGKTFSV